MQTRACFLRSMTVALVLLTPGCKSSFTYKLWTTDEFRHVREHATNSSVAVYYEAERKDYLISYDSVRDGGDAPRRLNYFLGENRERIMERKKPRFVSTNRLTLSAMPVNENTNAVPSVAFDGTLTIYSDNGQI